MKTWIALFRGINVGGNHILPMAELRQELTALGLSEVQSYIQSGNVVFSVKTGTSTSWAKKISACVEEQHGFAPQVMVLDAAAVQAAVDANPFPEGVDDPKTLHFSFLEKKPSKPMLKEMEELRIASERFQLIGQVFYLHAPDGIGRSKLAAKVEKLLGVSATGRNYRTVAKILSMAGA